MTYLHIITVLLALCKYSANASAIDNVLHFQMSQDSDVKPEMFKHEDPIPENAIKFSFAKYFQDHMVLQQAPKRANIFGYSPIIGLKVIAMMTTDKKKYYYESVVEHGPAPGIGKWVITLDPIKTTAPATIYVASDNGTLQLNDVLFGDVWLCSGQSNMEFTLSMMTNGSEEIKAADKYPNIRVMTVAMTQATSPQFDLIGTAENWSVPSSTTVGGKAWTYFSAVCWMYGKAIYEAQGYPIGLIATDWGGTPVEAWSSPDALAKCNISGTGDEALQHHTSEKKSILPSRESHGQLGGPQENSVLWNAMIHPFLGLTFYGAIWYQGEADAISLRMNHYNCTFPAMIEDWRSKFSKTSNGQTSADFPFGFVQLAPNGPPPTKSVGFPDIRWHQTADYGYVPNPKMPNVFMAVAMDLPDVHSPYGSIHPRDKQDVCQRLALSALAVAYNHSVMYQGPLPSNVSKISTNKLLINYGADWKLVMKNINGFEVLCTPSTGGNPKWIATPIISSTNVTITIYLGVCGSELEALRYAWRVTPCAFKACAVYSTVNSLPAPPFIAFAKKDTSGNVIFQFN